MLFSKTTDFERIAAKRHQISGMNFWLESLSLPPEERKLPGK